MTRTMVGFVCIASGLFAALYPPVNAFWTMVGLVEIGIGLFLILVDRNQV